MATVSQSGFFTLQAFTSLGALMAGGKLFTYTAGTTTHKTAYTDAAGAVAQTYTSDDGGVTQYIALDARGELPSPLYLTAGAYDIALKTAAGATVWTRRADPTGADLAASTGSASIGFLQSGTGAVARTAQAKMRDVVSVTDFGAVGDGVTDDTVAIQAAFTAATGGSVYIPEGVYMCSALTVPAETMVYGDGSGSVLKKRANGAVITLGKHGILQNFKIDGNGATYTGRGVVVDDGAAATITSAWWRRFVTMVIEDTESYCVEFVGDSDGYQSEIIGGQLTTYGSSAVAVKMPATETNGNRRMIGVMCFGTSIADLGGSDNTTIIGCEGISPIYSSTTKKARVIGNRLVLGSGSTINGIQGIFALNAIAETTWTLAAGLSASFVTDNSFATPLALTNSVSAGGANILRLPRTTYTPTWTGGTPAIGDGSLNGSYVLDGDTCKVSIQLIMGSTTTYGSGAWTFTLPLTALSRTTAGSAVAIDSSPSAAYSLSTIVRAGASTVQVLASSSTALVGSATPFAWASGDELYLTFEYPIR